MASSLDDLLDLLGKGKKEQATSLLDLPLPAAERPSIIYLPHEYIVPAQEPESA